MHHGGERRSAADLARQVSQQRYGHVFVGAPVGRDEPYASEDDDDKAAKRDKQRPTWLPTCIQVKIDGKVCRAFRKGVASFYGDLDGIYFSYKGNAWRWHERRSEYALTAVRASRDGYHYAGKHHGSARAMLGVARAVGWLWGRPMEGRAGAPPPPVMSMDLTAHHGNNKKSDNRAKSITWITALHNAHLG